MEHPRPPDTIRNIIISGIIILVILFFVFLFTTSYFSSNRPKPEAFITVISYQIDNEMSSPSETPNPLLTTQTSNPNAIYAKGMTIYINGTGGDGLRIRDTASQKGSTLYVASDGDRYEIIDGPELNDGYIWWQIRNNANGELNGWAVQDFMSTNPVISEE